VRRLDAAIRKEEKPAVAAAADGDGVAADGKGNGGGKGNKRKRTGDGEEEGNGDASLEAAKLEGMSYPELQGLANSRGLAANGSKKDVIKRLLLASANAIDGVQDEKRAPKGLIISFFFFVQLCKQMVGTLPIQQREGYNLLP
jgi:poly [ADP-ribose] polymerase